MQRFFLPLILLIATFLLSYRLYELMPFIGDQGWFYLSARDFMQGNIPLVGIASSHPWLHQGPIWTYLLGLTLPLFRFDPLGGGYLAVVIGIATVWLLYKVAFEMFNHRIALIASLLFATSPLIIMHARMPYHTSPIPFFVILFVFSLWKLIQGKTLWLPVSIFSLAMLYNFELATIPFWFVLLTVLGFGYWKKQKWFKQINKKILFYSSAALLIPMLPILLHDSQNGFPQTVKFAAWIGYKILVLFGFPRLHPEIMSPSWSSVFLFAGEQYQKLLYIDSGLVAFTIFLFSFGYFVKRIVDQYKHKKFDKSFVLLALTLIVSLSAYFVSRTPSEAYMPMLFPSFILLTAIWLERFMQKPVQKVLTLCILALIVIGNIHALIIHQYYTGEYRYTYAQRISVAKQIISEANGKSYNIRGNGDGSKFESFTMNYQYLLWWLGNEPKKEKQKIQFTISEEKNMIRVSKEEF